MNIFILAIGVWFGLIETSYFGWNLTAQSDAEIICDGITLLICSLAFLKS